MNKFCNKHGNLKLEDIQIEKIKWKTKDGEEKNGKQLRCRLCRREKDMKWKHDHREQHIASSTRWKKSNREHYNEWIRQDRLNNPEKHKKWSKTYREKKGVLRSLEESLRLRHMDIETYNKMLEKQNNVCALCLKPETRKSKRKGEICRLMIDHCHSTNIIRGLLCHNCNAGLGLFKDDIQVLKTAITYLEKHSHVE